MDTVLQINNLTKNYGRITAVNNLSLTIERGSVFGILGPNGSGKTTTLGILLDVINKTSGDFSWFGQPPSKEVRKRIGAILETPIFYPYLNAVKNLEIVAEIKDAPKANIDIVLQKVDLYERRYDNFKTYSLGMRQRLSIASALLCDPEVMILDEPTNGLDPQGIAEIRELIKQIAKEGKTIILASHLLDEVQKVCSHFCVLKKGQLLHVGSVAEVTQGAELVEVKADNTALLQQSLQQFEGVKNVTQEEDKFIVTLSEGQTASDLNQFLFSQNLVASHLLTQRKSLEKQFLEVLAQSDHA
ncbi:ATP-binding cassette domain-containing protein [Fulvivirga maritima]|uniref:ABC transporter ATP-binding protein n=1 Tax=Fulvivirga maritima TaxID=2904247 RepID=UPI001F1B7AE0|nr:ATP-binding cassette domain-containing protein [Fulvivirga maritima]UII24428.1 ATP-binding cassette domain-containing protein [Fulvivirga maritima]